MMSAGVRRHGRFPPRAHVLCRMNGEYSDELEKDNDHGGDALRYGLPWLFPSQTMGSFGGGDYDDKSDDTTLMAGLWEKKF
jgi:hypothetical protein